MQKKLSKFLFLLLLIVTIICFSGCFINYYSTARYGSLVGIHYLDENKNSLETKIFEKYASEYSIWTSKHHLQKLNAPAPKELYYVTEAEEHHNYYVVFEIEEKNGYTLSSIVCKNIDYKEMIISQDELIKNQELPGDNIEYYYYFEDVKFTKEDKTNIGSNKIGSRTYIDGFGFDFKYSIANDNPDVIIANNVLITGKEKLIDLVSKRLYDETVLINYQDNDINNYVQLAWGYWNIDAETEGSYFRYYDINNQIIEFYEYFYHNEFDGIDYYYLSHIESLEINDKANQDQYKIIYMEEC